MLLLNAAAMREADRYAIEDLGIPGHTLMECAGRAAVSVVLALKPTHVGILCGGGNNGGDGLVAARLLADRGVRVTVLMASEPGTDDATLNASLLERMKHGAPDLPLTVHHGRDEANREEALGSMQSADVLVDAMLGTGLSSTVREPYASLIGWMNAHSASRVSLDVPSGLSSDTGAIWGTGVRAHHTISFGAAKTGLFIGNGPDVAGHVRVADIGIPGFVLRNAGASPGCAVLQTAQGVRAHLHPRTRNDNKYTTGPAVIIGGSAQFPGAPTLAARAAARAGSGYVVVACSPAIRTVLLEKLTEIPVVAWDQDASHMVPEALGTHWDKARSVVLGPGLGRSPDATRLVKTVLESFDGPVVVDADALRVLNDDPEWASAHARTDWILTPHAGELPTGTAKTLSDSGPVTAAHELATSMGAVVVLKGMPAVIAHPDGRCIVNASGNPAAGTAGTGDVLAGIIGGLLATGVPAFEAAAAGMHIAGTAADRFVQEHASQSMMAGDIVDRLPALLADYN